jgi:hypothetical protein
MVIISNVIFTVTEIFLLGCIFKEATRLCDTVPKIVILPVGPTDKPVDLSSPPDTKPNLINRNMCIDVFQPKQGPPLMPPPTYTVYVDQSAKHGPSQTYFSGCYQFNSLIDKENNLYGWEVIEGNDGRDRISAVFGNASFPNINCNGWIAFRGE